MVNIEGKVFGRVCVDKRDAADLVALIGSLRSRVGGSISQVHHDIIIFYIVKVRNVQIIIILDEIVARLGSVYRLRAFYVTNIVFGGGQVSEVWLLDRIKYGDGNIIFWKYIYINNYLLREMRISTGESAVRGESGYG